MEVRGPVARCKSSRRFQPGDDGVGRDGLPSSPADVSGMSRAQLLQGARGARARGKIFASEEEDHPVRARFPRWRCLYGSTHARCVSDGGHVGVAGVKWGIECEVTGNDQRAMPDAASLHHRYRLHCSGCPPASAARHERKVDAGVESRYASIDRLGAEDFAESRNYLE